MQLLIGFFIVKIRANANFSEGTGNLTSSVLSKYVRSNVEQVGAINLNYT